jgi:hypothetical protein
MGVLRTCTCAATICEQRRTGCHRLLQPTFDRPAASGCWQADVCWKAPANKGCVDEYRLAQRLVGDDGKSFGSWSPVDSYVAPGCYTVKQLPNGVVTQFGLQVTRTGMGLSDWGPVPESA